MSVLLAGKRTVVVSDFARGSRVMELRPRVHPQVTEDQALAYAISLESAGMQKQADEFFARYAEAHQVTARY